MTNVTKLFSAYRTQWVQRGVTPVPPPTPLAHSQLSRLELASVAAPTFVRFAPGSVRPNGTLDSGTTNVGVRPGVNLTVVNNSITATAGMVISGKDIYGNINIAGAGVTITDCIVRGVATSLDPTNQSPTSDCSLIIGSGNDLKGAVIEFCRLDGTGRESPWKDAIRGGNYTMRYTEIMRTNDGIGAMAVGNATIECCRIYHGYYTAWLNSTTGLVYPGNPPSPSDHTSHSDGMQVQGYQGWMVNGCYVGGTPGNSNMDHIANRDWAVPAQRANILSVQGGDYTNSSFIIQNNINGTNVVGCTVQNCWVEGGAARFNLVPTAGGDNLSGVSILNNRLIRATWTGNYVNNYILRNGCAAKISGNVFDDNGAAVPITG